MLLLLFSAVWEAALLTGTAVPLVVGRASRGARMSHRHAKSCGEQLPPALPQSMTMWVSVDSIPAMD
jgi:hypothetical protein